MYRTRDLARWRRDGSIEFLGRRDSQVKLRGFRIEPAEIEACLERHPLVRRAAITAVEQGAAGMSLYAFFVPRDQRLPSSDELRKHVLAALPAYMLPAVFTALDALPEMPNGKTDRRALLALALRPRTVVPLQEPPRTTRRSACWPSGRRHSDARTSGSMTTSSTIWAATRCWQRPWWRERARIRHGRAAAIDLEARTIAAFAGRSSWRRPGPLQGSLQGPLQGQQDPLIFPEPCRLRPPSGESGS